MLYFKSCPRCRGDMYLNHDFYGDYKVCLQCGLTEETEKPGRDDGHGRSGSEEKEEGGLAASASGTEQMGRPVGRPIFFCTTLTFRAAKAPSTMHRASCRGSRPCRPPWNPGRSLAASPTLVWPRCHPANWATSRRWPDEGDRPRSRSENLGSAS